MLRGPENVNISRLGLKYFAMSNSGHKSKHVKGFNNPSASHPNPWSEWGWDENKNCAVRFRKDSKGQWQFDYDKEKYDREQTKINVPRTPHSNSLGPISDSTQYSTLKNYTSNRVVDNVTEKFAQTHLHPASPVVVRTSDPLTTNEAFDPNYKVHQSWEYQWGRVLWTEPKGSVGDSSVGTESVREGLYGQLHHEKVRRFLIIKKDSGHCLCLPIMTYGSQGTKKKGVHAGDHAIIFTDQPQIMPGEEKRGLRKRPIRVIPDDPRHKLDPASRLNYAKVYTVEHNVKVWFIGRLAKESEQQVVADYNVVNPPLTHRSFDTPPAATHTQEPSPGNYASNSYNNEGYSMPSMNSYGTTYPSSTTNSGIQYSTNTFPNGTSYQTQHLQQYLQPSYPIQRTYQSTIQHSSAAAQINSGTEYGESYPPPNYPSSSTPQYERYDR